MGERAMKKFTKEPKYVLLKWLDSATTLGWQGIDEQGPAKIESIGWLVHDAKETLTISTSKNQFGKFLDQLVIPKACIISRLNRGK